MRKLKVPNIRDVKHLRELLHCSKKTLNKVCAHPEWFYAQFPLRVGDKIRPIKQPTGKLDDILHKVKRVLDKIELPPYVHGGVKKHSPITNAAPHIRKAAVLNFDIADFFPSVRPRQVYEMFYKHCRFPADVARILTRLVTFEGQLPQGSPTSTAVANLVILPLTHRLYRLTQKHGCDYSQFVDDGTVSGPGYIENLRPLIDKIIKQEGFQASPKPHKRTTKYRHEEQIVTGVVVNRKIGAPKQKILDVKKELNELHTITGYGKKISRHKIASVNGKIQHIKTLDEQIGKTLKNKLGKILNKAS